MGSMKKVLVTGASGLIGGHLAKSLLAEGLHVRAVGRRPLSEWFQLHPRSENLQLDLSEKANCHRAVEGVDEVYNLAAEIGGVKFIEENKALCMLSVLINTHLLLAARDAGVQRYFYTSTFGVAAADTKPASVLEDGHIWEKLFSEKFTRYFGDDFGIQTRIGRLQNVYGIFDRWGGDRERAPVALCRKVIEAKRNSTSAIEIWGDGTQTRNFLYVEDAVRGIKAVMQSDIREPVRIGTNEFVTINQLVDVIEAAAGVKLERRYNTSAHSGIVRKPDEFSPMHPRLGWQPKVSLVEGMTRLYQWLEGEIDKKSVLA